MSLVLGFAAVALFSFLAFWKLNALLFMLLAGASLMVGFQWYDVYTTPVGLTMSLIFIAYSLVSLGLAFRCIFWKENKDEE